MSKDYAERFGTETAMEVYTPNNPQTESDPLSLHLDQATHQHVINGSPRFDNGIIIKSGQKLIFDGE